MAALAADRRSRRPLLVGGASVFAKTDQVCPRQDRSGERDVGMKLSRLRLMTGYTHTKSHVRTGCRGMVKGWMRLIARADLGISSATGQPACSRACGRICTYLRRPRQRGKATRYSTRSLTSPLIMVSIHSLQNYQKEVIRFVDSQCLILPESIGYLTVRGMIDRWRSSCTKCAHGDLHRLAPHVGPAAVSIPDDANLSLVRCTTYRTSVNIASAGVT